MSKIIKLDQSPTIGIYQKTKKNIRLYANQNIGIHLDILDYDRITSSGQEN